MTDKVFKVDISLKVKKSVKVRARDEAEARILAESELKPIIKEMLPEAVQVREI